jgi:hypothetical protein
MTYTIIDLKSKRHMILDSKYRIIGDTDKDNVALHLSHHYWD